MLIVIRRWPGALSRSQSASFSLTFTAYELLRWMQIANPHHDVNSVRPRLTELKDAGAVRTSGRESARSPRVASIRGPSLLRSFARPCTRRLGRRIRGSYF